MPGIAARAPCSPTTWEGPKMARRGPERLRSAIPAIEEGLLDQDVSWHIEGRCRWSLTLSASCFRASASSASWALCVRRYFPSLMGTSLPSL